MRTFIALAIVSLVAACETQADRMARMQREVDEMIAVYGAACDKLGYKRDSDSWRNCVIRLNTNNTITQYRISPTTTTCFGHRGFFECTTF